MSESSPAPAIVELSSKAFMAASAVLAAVIVAIGFKTPIPPYVVAIEVMATVLGLFLLGSYKYRLDKNALTYGSVLVVAATFFTSWWPASSLRAEVAAEGAGAVARFAAHHFLTFDGLEHLIHLDTMLFILGLTFFVAVISQTRILESVSFTILTGAKGSVFVTVALITGIVSFASGILDGVSMIGLLIRVLIILLLLGKVMDSELIFFTIMSTMITTICGMWLAYGEPPNLIMKTNLRPHLTDGFFIRYCLPVAIASYLVLFFNMKRRLKGRQIDLGSIDFFERNTADIRFLQIMRHGEVFTDLEFAEHAKRDLGRWHDPVVEKLHAGESIGSAMVTAGVPTDLRKRLFGELLTPELANDADAYFTPQAQEGGKAAARLNALLSEVRARRVKAQRFGVASFAPFLILLAAHALNHEIPLFLASAAGFVAAFVGIASLPNMRTTALREAAHEYKEYLFLFPLFLSIALLTRTGFFDQLADLIHVGIERIGASTVAFIQFTGATLLSAILDNNVVADFASRALHGLPDPLMHLFAMAQIAGYALGGCWTHIGSAQSVVAYSFIQKEIDPHFTPMNWIKLITPCLLQIFVVATVLIYIEGALLSVLK